MNDDMHDMHDMHDGRGRAQGTPTYDSGAEGYHRLLYIHTCMHAYMTSSQFHMTQ
jgi:hypothetical protein